MQQEMEEQKASITTVEVHTNLKKSVRWRGLGELILVPFNNAKP